jgi:hypothetical protein
MTDYCTHTCARCNGLFTHYPNCDGKYCAPEFGLCATCMGEGYQIGYCPACHETKPMNQHELICDDCNKPKLRTA